MRLTETYSRVISEDTRIDAARGVIFNVKLNGNRSKNARSYPDSTLERATPLFEGAKVYADHDDHPLAAQRGVTAVRQVGSLLGRMRNVRFAKGGHRADFHVLPSKRGLLEDVKADPEAFGFSHVIDGRIAQRRNEAGEEVVEEITHVASVDLVTDPATTRSVFEHRQPKETAMSADVQAVYESRLKERDERVAALERELSESKQAHTTVAAELEATKTLLAEKSTKLTEAEAKLAEAEDAARIAQIQKIVADAGFGEEIAESLKSLSVEAATTITESLKAQAPQSGTKPRSEPRMREGNSSDPLAVDDDAFLAAVTGGTHFVG